MVRTANTDHEKVCTVHRHVVAVSSAARRLAVTVTTEVPTLPVRINHHTRQRIVMSAHILHTIMASQQLVLAYPLIQREVITNPRRTRTLPMEIQQTTMVT